jgi:hypothetical protein
MPSRQPPTILPVARRGRIFVFRAPAQAIFRLEDPRELKSNRVPRVEGHESALIAEIFYDSAANLGSPVRHSGEIAQKSAASVFVRARW